MEALVRGYVFPQSWEQESFRAYCHRYDARRRELVAVAVASPFKDARERSSIATTPRAQQIGKYVIAEAFYNHRVAYRELGEEWNAEGTGIWDAVRTVIAVPIIDQDDGRRVLGTVSLDTSLDLARADFKNRNAAGVLSNAAEAISWLWHT